MTNMPPPTEDWNMVSCANCGLLVGWTRTPMTEPFYCIPCFDQVAHIPAARRATLRPADYDKMSAQEQWGIDKKLGILDWNGKEDS